MRCNSFLLDKFPQSKQRHSKKSHCEHQMEGPYVWWNWFCEQKKKWRANYWFSNIELIKCFYETIFKVGKAVNLISSNTFLDLLYVCEGFPCMYVYVPHTCMVSNGESLDDGMGTESQSFERTISALTHGANSLAPVKLILIRQAFSNFSTFKVFLKTHIPASIHTRLFCWETEMHYFVHMPMLYLPCKKASFML